MKEFGRFPAVILASILALSAAAPVRAEDPKIGYIDLTRALNQVREGIEGMAELTREFRGKQERIDAMQNDLRIKKEDFDAKESGMGEVERRRLQEDLQRDYMVLQQTYVQLQQELMEREQEVAQVIDGKMRDIIKALGARHEYLMILDIGSAVLYHREGMDLTDEAISEYDRVYGKK